VANNYVLITTTGQRHAAALLALVNNLANQRDILAQVKADMDQMTDGVSYATIESAFGLPAGKGQTVYNLVAGALAEVNAATTFNNLLTYLGAIRA
jgi:hypothetical protein